MSKDTSNERIIGGVVHQRHLNGGGFVAVTAVVEDTAYVGPDAIVTGKA